MPYTVSTILITAIGAALLAFQWNYYSQLSQISSTCVEPGTEPEVQHSGYFEYECAGKPHHASWGSWWHPQRTSREDRERRGQGAGTSTKDWNILYHLGGNGPWVEKVHNVVEGGIAVPEGCRVEQVHMMSRHAERYPTVKAGTSGSISLTKLLGSICSWSVKAYDVCTQGMKQLLDKMKSSGVTFQGDLAFVNDWELFWSDDSQLAQLTSTGPFSGTLGSFTTGVRLRTRYNHLIPKANIDRPSTTKFWASDSQRVIDTARYFAAGFFGLNWQNSASLGIISEGPDLGADTLTPGDTCPKYLEDEEEGWAKGWKSMHKYRATYFPAIRKRLAKQNLDVEFNDDELYAMQEMCGFETTVRGGSHWCDVFTQEDFLHFEYARDVHHYYRAGPGTKYGAGLGWLWLNATTNLMIEGPDAGGLFFSFVHDDDVAPMIAALDIITPSSHLPLDHIPTDRIWRKSQVSPMGGRVLFELLSCETEKRGWLGGRDRYVRININDGVTAIPGCDTGPGKSCRLSAFKARVKKKGDEVGDYREMCGLGNDSTERITFLHQHQ